MSGWRVTVVEEWPDMPAGETHAGRGSEGRHQAFENIAACADIHVTVHRHLRTFAKGMRALPDAVVHRALHWRAREPALKRLNSGLPSVICVRRCFTRVFLHVNSGQRIRALRENSHLHSMLLWMSRTRCSKGTTSSRFGVPWRESALVVVLRGRQ